MPNFSMRRLAAAAVGAAIAFGAPVAAEAAHAPEPSPVVHWSDDYVLIDAHPGAGYQWYADGDGLQCLKYGKSVPLVFCIVNPLGFGLAAV